MIKIGDVVIYVDENGKSRDAIVQCVHSQKYINVLTVSLDETKTDCYGRQSEHATSVGLREEFNKAGRHFMTLGSE